MIKVNPYPKPWMFSAIYKRPDPNIRLDLWRELYQLSQSHQDDWLIGRDFNKILRATENWVGMLLAQIEWAYLDNVLIPAI